MFEDDENLREEVVEVKKGNFEAKIAQKRSGFNLC